jgi:Holliday junction resolvase
MDNKRLGNSFENEVCEVLARNGYWVHFIVPDARGAQPFDIISAKDNIAYAIECKTLTESRKSFSIDRLEDNQLLAFERWIACGNHSPVIAIKYDEKIYCVEYLDIKYKKSIKMNECMLFSDYFGLEK